MKRYETPWYQHFKLSTLLMTGFAALLVGVSPKQAEAVNLGGATHIGTFEGQTTFQTSSSNGINPGLYLEVMDSYGNYTEYTSEDGIITIDGTEEGAYVTQAKLLGKTKYVDQDTGEILDEWEDGRNLTLESSKTPVLKTVGENLIDDTNLKNDNLSEKHITSAISVKLTPNRAYYVGLTFKDEIDPSTTYFTIEYKDEDGIVIATKYQNQVITFTKEEAQKIKYMNVFTNLEHGYSDVYVEHLWVVESDSPTAYKPYQSSILTTSEKVELRGIAEARDELDLITGDLTVRLNEITLNGSESEIWSNGSLVGDTARFSFFTQYMLKPSSGGICNLFPYIKFNNEDMEHVRIDGSEPYGFINIWIKINRLTGISTADFKNWLQQNPIKIQGQLATDSIKTVNLNSTHDFPTITNRQVSIEGEILPLICSVTTPTEPLSFVLNPNLEVGQQFIAPDFTISNDSPASVSIELKHFKQTSNVLNDVEPTKYQNWSTLTKLQSKDIALAIEPKAGEGWEQLYEGPRYVSDQTSSILGEIKPHSSVELGFTALHGQAFTESLSPRYQLIFLFDF